MIKGIKNLFLLTCVLFLSISYVNSVKTKRRKYCHANEMGKCWEGSRYFSARVNGTGIPITENELDWACGQQEIAATRCATTWLKKCGNNFHREIYENFAVKPLLETLYELCDPAMGHRDTFLQKAPCLHYKVKMMPEYRSICVRDLQAGLEWMQDTIRENLTEQFQATCCMYNRWEKCITDYLIQECGPTGDQSIRILIGTATTFVLGEFCKFKKFHPEADLCQPYYQPKDLVPKGLLSNSYGSWFFSYSCPNIGFGITLERDV